MTASNKNLSLYKTSKFSVIGLKGEDQCRRNDNDHKQRVHVANASKGRSQIHTLKDGQRIPTMSLSLLTHACKKSTSIHEKKSVSSTIWEYLEEFGFIILCVDKNSIPGKVIEDMKKTLHEKIFPDIGMQQDQISDKFESIRRHNIGGLESGSLYVSERGVPMWRVGYELCEGEIREAFRVHAGSPDSQPWQSDAVRNNWIRAMHLCRYICDIALDLTLGYDLKKRRGSGLKSWMNCSSVPPIGEISDRHDDYSVFYAMNYFNDMQSKVAQERDQVIGSDNELLNVKEHVDPSLFVIEPFLPDIEGLQVQSTKGTQWITCDGKASPIHDVVSAKQEFAMVLFQGRAFAKCAHTLQGRQIKPTNHRVIAARRDENKQRRTMIYEQKYAEYFSEAIMD